MCYRFRLVGGAIWEISDECVDFDEEGNVAKRISGSVGKSGRNNEADILTIQKLLNKHASKTGFRRLTEDSMIGRKTITAIGMFQKKFVGIRPDGRVDPSGKTMAALNGEKKEDKKGSAKDKKDKVVKKGKGGKVTGKRSGVNSKIIGVLEAVADHYGANIPIFSGKRDASGQANAMWNNWTKNVKRGKMYVHLRKNPKIRKELDDYYNERKKNEFRSVVIKIAPKLSLHLRGQAVDISPKSALSSKMVRAIKMHLHHINEKTCHHFDSRGKSVPKTISEEMKAKWP